MSKYGPRDYADMMCTDAYDGTYYWESYDLNDEFVTYYATKVKSNESIYSAEDSSIVYKFPMVAGKSWTQKDILFNKNVLCCKCQ